MSEYAIQQLTTATPEAKPANDPASDRLATCLLGTGAVVVVLGAEEGATRVDYTDPSASAFFTRYVIPAFARLSPPAASAEPQFDDRVPGVLARILPATSAKRGVVGTATLVLAKREGFTANTEDVQRLCSQLGLDTQWLDSEAAHTPALTPAVLARLADLAATTIGVDTKVGGLRRELDSLSSQLSDTYEELTLIYQISSGMRVNRSVDDFFLQACTDVIDVMSIRGAAYAITDANGGVSASSLYGEVDLDADTLNRLTGDLLRHFESSARAILVNDLSVDPTYDYLAGMVSRLVAVPIQRGEKILGTFVCLDKLNADFTTTDSKLLNSIANETAIYLENQTLFSDARGLMMGLLHALTSAVDAKDTYTCGHSQRVALFGREIAKRAGLPDALCERVYMAGLLHDVGKIGVPEEVLRKPGKLTDEEFVLMKKHVEIGARILKDVAQITDLIPGVLYHHERYDGKGYPHNLSGQQIPLVARILCVADCFDAMTSNRTYRKALPIEVALLEIRRCSGTQFDPVLADAFLSLGASRLRELIASVTEQTAIRLAA